MSFGDLERGGGYGGYQQNSGFNPSGALPFFLVLLRISADHLRGPQAAMAMASTFV